MDPKPLPGAVSIPNVTFIEWHLILLQKPPKLILE